jgi:hypothetical protein
VRCCLNLYKLTCVHRGFLIRTVYELCRAERLEEGFPTCQDTYFFKLWREDPLCSQIKVRKHLRFAKCELCVELRERRTVTRDPKALEALNKEVRAHHIEVKQERAAYYVRRLQAVQQPHKYMSVIIDLDSELSLQYPCKQRVHAHTFGRCWGWCACRVMSLYVAFGLLHSRPSCTENMPVHP